MFFGPTRKTEILKTMKKTKLLFLITLLLVLSAVPAFAQKTDIFGYYFIEKPSKAFADISEINLAGDEGLNDKPVFYGLIRMTRKAAKDFILNKPEMDGKNITFTTKAVAGVNYQFSGAFTKLDDFPANPPEGVILQGTLTKLKGKTKLAEAKVKFTYSPGD